MQSLNLLLQEHALQARLLLQLVDGGLEPGVQLVPLLLYPGKPLLQDLLLPLQVLELLLGLQEPLLGELQRELVLLVVADLLPQNLDLLRTGTITS